MSGQLERLLEKNEPAWPLVCDWIRAARRPVEVLPPSEPGRGEALLQLRVTTRSPMGAVVYETGGLLIEDGWLRILGSGHERLPRSLPAWNLGRTWHDPSESSPLLLVADDAVGGFFAVNGSALDGPPGHVFYFAPDSLGWEDLGCGYTQFLRWTLSGDLDGFYEALRWPGWRTELLQLRGDQGFSIFPFLWAAGPPLAERSRRPIPIAELYDLQQGFLRQLNPEASSREAE